MKVLVSAYTGLGNFILKTPMINYLSEFYSGCKIDLLCGPDWGADKVLEYSGLINNVHWLPLDFSIVEKMRRLKKLKNENYDLIILPFDSTPSFLLWGSNFYFSDSRVIAHFNLYSSGSLHKIKRLFSLTLLSNVEWIPILHGRHEIDLNLDLIDAQSYKHYTDNRNRKTIVTYDLTISMPELPNKYIVLQPSARNGVASPKTWSISRFQNLVVQILEQYSEYQIVLVGDTGDLNALVGHPILDMVNVKNLIGKTDFSQLCFVLKNASAVIANDSGIMHVANALEAPLIALYGPTDHTRTRPLADSSEILYSDNDCLCQCYAFKNGEDILLKKFGESYCMEGIKESDVMENIDYLIGEEHDKTRL